MHGRSSELYLVRHCRATGQEPEAPLTEDGLARAEALADLLTGLPITRVVSSPYRRAVESVGPLCRRAGLELETDPRLVERVLAGGPLPDWRERLRASFDDLDLRLEGGESSREAMARAAAAAEDALARGGVPVLVTHGNLMTLLLKRYDARFGYEDWQRLDNPDTFRVALAADGAQVERVRTEG